MGAVSKRDRQRKWGEALGRFLLSSTTQRVLLDSAVAVMVIRATR